ncbi:hypothetical protein MA16_Dca003199 [Dendrobium catenatum]|uniref:Uncharacterized protein n=1 Tax=Dendrobium catenatum TaxID=906689 RepID=A0A2I0XC28_9ASPA|nr:hypothetical protein MA16_Dca003199 [Dendrobium catenatum]
MKIVANIILEFVSILVLEYFAFWKNRIPWIHFPVDTKVCCHDCWSSSSLYFDYCTKYWFGISSLLNSFILFTFYAHYH